MLGPGGAEAAFPAAVARHLEELNLAEDRCGRPQEDELRDPGPGLDPEGLPAVVVYEGDLDLTAVARVYEARRVDEGDPMPHREAAARKHEPRITLRYSYRDPGPHQRPGARRQVHLLDRTKIIASIPRMGPLRHYRRRDEAAKRDLQRTLGAHRGNGSIGGFMLQAAGGTLSRKS